MGKFVRRAIVATVATVAAIGLTATAAYADTTYTVSNGGPFTASLVPGTMAVGTDITTRQSNTCTIASAAGEAPNGSGLPATGLAHINDFTLGTEDEPCMGPLQSEFRTVKTSSSGWPINATGPTVDGVTPIQITNIQIRVTGNTLLGWCITDEAGTASGHYDNNTSVLTVDSAHLVMSTVNTDGCAGLVNDGDIETFTAQLQVTPKIQLISQG